MNHINFAMNYLGGRLTSKMIQTFSLIFQEQLCLCSLFHMIDLRDKYVEREHINEGLLHWFSNFI